MRFILLHYCNTFWQHVVKKMKNTNIFNKFQQRFILKHYFNAVWQSVVKKIGKYQNCHYDELNCQRLP